MNKQLLDEMENAVKETVTDKKIGVAFSGGVDSTPCWQNLSRIWNMIFIF